MVAISVRLHLGNEGLKSGNDVTPGHSCSLGVPRMLRHVRRCQHCQMTHNVPEDLEDLVNLRVTREERLAGGHLSKDTADGPHVYACAVLTSTEEDLRCTVPKSDDLGPC